MDVCFCLFILDTYASNHALGTELLQVQNGVERLIGFGSNYCTTKKELLAVVRFTRHFKHFIYAKQISICKSDIGPINKKTHTITG